ncbi:MAG TPA: efflux RND transporter periplasmic adaptor subunit [Beijerinckiaceae bacterium]|nr:efflux RND transporter periplasmic adaptor subunit [Beijerinckiaceae bacterium]
MRLKLLVAMASMALLSTAQAQQSAPVPTVIVKAAELREIGRDNEFIGKIEAVERVEIRARVSGLLEAPKFRDGEKVKAGQPLYLIEPDPFKAAVDAKEAQLASAKADAQNAALNLGRAQELLRTNAGTAATVDQRKAESAKADANVRIAEAALSDAKITLSYTDIRAPIDGRIGRTAITEGNIVSPSNGPLAVIVKEDQMRVVFSVSQREVLEYRKRKATKEPIVRLKLADGSLYSQTGAIDYIDNVVDSRTDGQVLRATFANPGGQLTHGQTVRVLIEQPAEGKQVVAPQVALAADQTGTFALVVDGQGMVSVRYVKVGQSSGDIAVITDGLKEGETVIVQGMQRVRPGMKVNAQRAEAGK